MNVLFCGDKHLSINRFDLAKTFLKWLNQTIEQNKPDLYVCLGDDLDTHAVIRSELLSELRYHFDYVLSLGIPIVYVVGNHDCFKPNNMKYHALQAMVGIHKNLYIVDAPQDLYNMTFVPYIFNNADFPKNVSEICVAHQTFNGATYKHIVAGDGLDIKKVSGCKKMISGHIHKRQSIRDHECEIIYPGSPFAQNANDIDEVKGVLLFNTDNWDEHFIECPLPQWKSLTLDLHSDSIDKINVMQNSKDNWVLNVIGVKQDIVNLLKDKYFIEITANVAIKVKTTFTDKSKQQKKIDAVNFNYIICQYIDTIYNGSIDKDILKNKILSILPN